MKDNWPLRSVSIAHCGSFSIRLALAAGFCLAAPALLSSPAKAQTVCDPGKTDCTINLNQSINGASPEGGGPWLSVQITDIVDGVSILFAPTLSGSEYITKVGLNLTQDYQDSNPAPFAGLEVSCYSFGSGICAVYNYVAQVDGYDIEGNAVGGFDLGFNFTGTGNGGRLTDTATVRFDLKGANLSAADLLGIINVQGVDVNVAAKVQGIANGGSGVVADPNGTPVPGPLPVLGAAAAFQASRRLRRRLKVSAAVAPRSA